MEDLSFREELEQETFGLDKDPADITPDDIRALPPIPNLRQPRAVSTARHWPPRRLSAEETAARAIRAERFLRMPVVHFTAEEAADAQRGLPAPAEEIVDAQHRLPPTSE